MYKRTYHVKYTSIIVVIQLENNEIETTMQHSDVYVEHIMCV